MLQATQQVSSDNWFTRYVQENGHITVVAVYAKFRWDVRMPR